MLEGAERRTSMCQAYYCTFHLRERYIVSVSSNFLTRISHGTRTKLLENLSESNILSRPLVSMLPNVHLLKLLFLARYYPSLNLL